MDELLPFEERCTWSVSRSFELECLDRDEASLVTDLGASYALRSAVSDAVEFFQLGFLAAALAADRLVTLFILETCSIFCVSDAKFSEAACSRLCDSDSVMRSPSMTCSTASLSPSRTTPTHAPSGCLRGGRASAAAGASPPPRPGGPRQSARSAAQPPRSASEIPPP